MGDKSSDFYPDEHSTRVGDGNSYIYEELLQTEGTDVKVYAVGVEYAHAEARKSPVVDGKVMRNARGREVRYPVILSTAEKEIARKVVLAFGQTLCGFDLLRSNGKSYVCDVNGWSFVRKFGLEPETGTAPSAAHTSCFGTRDWHNPFRCCSHAEAGPPWTGPDHYAAAD